MNWQSVLKKDSDYKKGKGYRNASPEKQKEIDEAYERKVKNDRVLRFKQFPALLRMRGG